MGIVSLKWQTTCGIHISLEQFQDIDFVPVLVEIETQWGSSLELWSLDEFWGCPFSLVFLLILRTSHVYRCLLDIRSIPRTSFSSRSRLFTVFIVNSVEIKSEAFQEFENEK
jgi:hypothetical protein